MLSNEVRGRFRTRPVLSSTVYRTICLLSQSFFICSRFFPLRMFSSVIVLLSRLLSSSLYHTTRRSLTTSLASWQTTLRRHNTHTHPCICRHSSSRSDIYLVSIAQHISSTVTSGLSRTFAQKISLFHRRIFMSGGCNQCNVHLVSQILTTRVLCHYSKPD